MKKLLITYCIFSLISCSPKEENHDGELTQSEIANMEETSEINVMDIEYDGTYTGKINGIETELKLNSQNFEWLQNGNRLHGSWSKINDATTIELKADNGNLPVKYLGYSDENSWMVLTDSMTIPTNEQFLKRIPD